MRNECYFCFNKSAQGLVKKHATSEIEADEFILKFHQLISNNWKVENPQLATLIQRLAREVFTCNDLYAEEKEYANKLINDNYSFWENLVVQNEYPLHLAAKLAIAGNVIDYGANSVPDDIEKSILEMAGQNLAIDHSEQLFEAIDKAHSILYLADNAGEMIFDKLFIETIGHKNVTFATRGYPVLNDVTADDAMKFGLHKSSIVISNGYDAPSTLLNYCSEEFKVNFETADLIISKGQGNFEGLMYEKHPNLFFMLMAKCDSMASLLNVNKGDRVLTTF